MKKIQSIINSKKILITNKTCKKFSIFIGSTSAVIEALVRGVNVMHITQNPIFDVYTKKLWPNIKVEKISHYTYKYSTNKKNNFIKFGNKNETFATYFST
jgi:predicted transcriptional regulator